jgi:N6-adenosine-specific RNA methylase IME4
MTKRALVKIPEDVKPITIGHFTLHETGVDVDGRPSFGEYEGVLEFARRAHKAAGWWVADLVRYGEKREDWKERLGQVIDASGYSEKTVKNLKYVGENVDPSRRRGDVDISLHSEVAPLAPADQVEWLEKAAVNGWSVRDLRLELRAAKRPTIIEGQAILEGMFPTIYADFPWRYGNRPPSGSGAGEHYPGMTVEEGCRLPVEAHASPNAVLFFWITAPYLYYATDPDKGPDAYRIIRAWGFTPKTGMVWDKVEHNFGNYVSIRHEHLIIATRGKCTPVRPTPMIDSVLTERKDGPHSAKPESFRKVVERLYDGPYLELFGRERREGWTVFGNDARLWATQAEQQQEVAV